MPLVVPARRALHERLASVLEVVYLVFNEGYTATGGATYTLHYLGSPTEFVDTFRRYYGPR